MKGEFKDFKAEIKAELAGMRAEMKVMRQWIIGGAIVVASSVLAGVATLIFQALT